MTKTSKRDAEKCVVAQLAQDKHSLQHHFRTVYDTEFRQFVSWQLSAHEGKSYSRFTVLSRYRQKTEAGAISAHIAFPVHLSLSLFSRMSLMQLTYRFFPAAQQICACCVFCVFLFTDIHF